MIKVNKINDITFVNAAVTDFSDSLGYCEYKIPLSIKGIRPRPTQALIQGTKAHHEREQHEREHVQLEPVTMTEIENENIDIEFARENIYSTLTVPFEFPNQNVVVSLSGRIDKILRADGTLIVQDDKFVAKPQTYDSKTQPYPGQLLQVLAYLNSNFSSKRKASPEDYFEMPHTQKQWQLRICDRKTREPYKIFSEVQDSFSLHYLQTSLEKFASITVNLTEPEQKRKAIGRVFVEVFDEASKEVEGANWLAQGTIYPDVIESVSATGGPSATIKSHHNVGGLPDYMTLKVVEPLRLIFKDEVRRVGKALGIKATLLARHPFPGPGLGIRIIGDVTAEKVRVLQEVDAIFINGLKDAGLYDEVWQAGAMLLPVQSVGVMGDARTYENLIALRAVTSVDGMTADYYDLSHEILNRCSSEIINKVKGVNRVVYDITSKPPGTIEWE